MVVGFACGADNGPKRGWGTIAAPPIVRRQAGNITFGTNHYLVRSHGIVLNMITFRLSVGIARDFEFEYFSAVNSIIVV